MAEEAIKVVKTQTALEDKVGGRTTFSGMTVHEIITELVQIKETKLAEKVKSDFKVTNNF